MSEVTEIEEKAKEIVENISHERGKEVEEEEVENRLMEFLDYGVSLEEATDSVMINIASDHGLDRDEMFGEGSSQSSEEQDAPPVVDVGEIDEADKWVSVEVEVVELWDPNSDSISQVGLVADKTGQVQFTSWSKSDLQDIEQGKTYRLKAVITDEYEGRYQIKLNSQTEIKEIKEEKLREDIQGMMIQLKEGSGLIMRDEDGRVVDRNDESVEHDLRLKAVVDNGNGAYSQVIFGRELTEKLTGMSLQDAKELAKAEMSREVVANYMKEEVLGKYYRLNCIVRGNVYIVDSYEVVEDEVDVNKLLSKVRGV